MEKTKNYLNVETINSGNQIFLKIELKDFVNYEWEQCYYDAINRYGTITIMRTSGAPTVNDVTFNGKYAITKSFPINDLTKKEAKDFLSEFNNLLNITYKEYELLQIRKKNEKEKNDKIDEENRKFIDNLNSFFNN